MAARVPARPVGPRAVRRPDARGEDRGDHTREGWLAGGAHTTAITAACTDPVILAGISASVGTTCSDACACATANDRSLYNYAYTLEHETARETQASEAHMDPASAAMLLGVPLTSIPLLASAERSQGFRCSPPDDTLPPEDALVAALGPPPGGQAYYVNYSPLYPGKETGTPEDDWRTVNLEGLAFVDNLREVPTFLTAGARDLVVPPRSLAPALEAILGASQVDASSSSRLGVIYPDGAEHFVDLFAYPSAGHMVEMIEPTELSGDVETWVEAL